MGNEIGTDLLDDPLGTLPGAARNRPVLRFRDQIGQHEISVEGRVVLGAAPDADVVIADSGVSRIHCELALENDGLWVRDLNSRNGTFVDAVLVRDAHIREGSVLRVGKTDVAVSYDPVPTEVPLWPVERYGPLVGRSVPMRELFERMQRLAESESTVLIQGETGTGKELAARAIHETSVRHEGPFVVVDCGSLPENLIETELFGHVRGAFTGATETRKGALEAAHGGTVFLDEVGELPLSAQPKLLRFLEARTVRRIGETAQRAVDVRVIAATHRDLRTMVNRGAFREDLYFRLAVLPLTIPPLRDHPGDIPLLVQYFLPEGATANLRPDLSSELQRRPWDGNVRELRIFVDRALALGTDEALVMIGGGRAGGPLESTQFPPVPLDVPFKTVRERWSDYLEREYVSGLLERFSGNVTAVAEAAGINRTYVHRLMKKHGL